MRGAILNSVSLEMFSSIKLFNPEISLAVSVGFVGCFAQLTTSAATAYTHGSL
jgi:hypothetical protein